MHSLLSQLPPEERRKAVKVEQPEWTEPMLATLTRERFSSPDWIFERKLDGARVLAYKSGDAVQLLSRNKKPLNGTYPEVADALLAQPETSFILDGEVVAFKGEQTSFEALQGRIGVSNPEEARKRGIEIFYYIFDILYMAGYDLTSLPLIARKELLRQALVYKNPLRYLDYRREHGEKYYAEACKAGWEGLLAKDASSTYEHSRSGSWLKFKCVNEQEFAIGGYTEPKGKRFCLGALLVGYYQDGKLLYAGKVGTGYTDQTLRQLCQLMAPLERTTSPFAKDSTLPNREVHWLEPKLVAQIGFGEWTRYNKLRQPMFMGLRDDKEPEKVVREDQG
ncbi:non-homologous end-joining DNA ligase [Methanocella sp. MCL-LM]|uniref:non-homologous end-joining DNA ligase n=1 Tax=Methanocella sp. MCL-LM TaxID=3412035 RepID=UPI003C72ABFB